MTDKPAEPRHTSRDGTPAPSRGRSLARGGLAVLKWAAISLGVLLVLATAVAMVAVQTAAPIIAQNAPYPLYERDGSCSLGACDLPTGESFSVYADARELRMMFDIDMERAGGILRITVTDPDGRTRFDKTFTGAADAQSFQEHTTWTPIAGDWSVAYSATGFQGRVGVEAWGIGVPQDALG